MSAVPDFKKVLREAGYKATPGRLELLRVLWSGQKPLTVPEIKKLLKRKLDEVTLYRALEALTRANITRNVDLRHGHAHYELNILKKHHHHLVCNSCGTVEDIESCIVSKLEDQIAQGSRKFSQIYSHDLEFFGSCTSCATR